MGGGDAGDTEQLRRQRDMMLLRMATRLRILPVAQSAALQEKRFRYPPVMFMCLCTFATDSKYSFLVVALYYAVPFRQM